MSLGVSAARISNLGSSALYAAGAVALKSVGSYFRVLDTTGAPTEIQEQTRLREGITLGITGITALATQLLAPALKQLFQLKTKGQVELLRTGLVFVGYVAAESIGRLFTKATYNDMAKHFQKSTSSADKMLQQLSQFLWEKPSQRDLSFSGAFSKPISSHQPTLPLNPANFGRTSNASTNTVSPTFYSSHPHPTVFFSVSYTA